MWIDIVKKIAPTLVAAAGGGPFGGIAVKYLTDALLPDKPGADEGDLQAFLETASPEDLARVRQLDQDFKVKMKELGIQEKDLILKDKQNARKMFEVNIYPQIVLSAVFIVGYFIILRNVMSVGITLDDGMKALVFTLIGVITGEIPRIMAFWFGSSMGSKEKTKKITESSQ